MLTTPLATPLIAVLLTGSWFDCTIAVDFLLQRRPCVAIWVATTPAPPLVRSAPLGGFFYVWRVSLVKPPFVKAAISVEAQLQRLVDRGMVVGDHDEAIRYLHRIGYYRLSGYTLPFQNGGGGADHHVFTNPVTFEDVLDRYIFDRKLRLLLMDAIERIEVSVRAGLSNNVAERNGSHWFTDANIFNTGFDHIEYIREIKRQICFNNPDKQTVFIRHYYDNYSAPNMPPCWMVFEAVSFGVISKTVEHVKKDEFKELCAHYGIPHVVLVSWLHTISYVRNLCAHHSRVWNRVLTIKPAVAKRHKEDLQDNSRMYAVAIVLQILLGRIAPDNHWATRLKLLFEEHPAVPLAAMGFPDDWVTKPVWGLPPPADEA